MEGFWPAINALMHAIRTHKFPMVGYSICVTHSASRAGEVNFRATGDEEPSFDLSFDFSNRDARRIGQALLECADEAERFLVEYQNVLGLEEVEVAATTQTSDR